MKIINKLIVRFSILLIVINFEFLLSYNVWGFIYKKKNIIKPCKENLLQCYLKLIHFISQVFYLFFLNFIIGKYYIEGNLLFFHILMD